MAKKCAYVAEEGLCAGNFPPFVRFTIETMEKVWPTVKVLPLLKFLPGCNYVGTAARGRCRNNKSQKMDLTHALSAKYLIKGYFNGFSPLLITPLLPLSLFTFISSAVMLLSV